MTDTTTDKPKARTGRTRTNAKPTETAEQAAAKKAAKETADLKSSLYADATKALRAKYKAEFDADVARRYEAAGLTYQRRLTPEEKEQEQLAALLAKHPEFARGLVQNAVNPSGPAVVPSVDDQGGDVDGTEPDGMIS